MEESNALPLTLAIDETWRQPVRVTHQMLHGHDLDKRLGNDDRPPNPCVAGIITERQARHLLEM